MDRPPLGADAQKHEYDSLRQMQGSMLILQSWEGGPATDGKGWATVLSGGDDET